MKIGSYNAGVIPAYFSCAAFKPTEAAYFYTMDGERTFSMVFDLKDSSDIPPIGEPIFMALNARVQFIPVMNNDELQKGLKAWAKSPGLIRTCK